MPTTTPLLPHIQMMSRGDCCLCDDAGAVITAAAEQGWCTWEPVNVEQDKGLLLRYGMDVPVLLFEGKILFKHRVTAEQLESALLEIAGKGREAA